MANISIKNKILSLSPHIEMLVRHIYWKNISLLSKLSFSKTSKSVKSELDDLDYDDIARFLESSGVSKGSLLIVHSAYGPLKGRGKNYNEILDFFLNMIGDKGTLAMPAMPKFSNTVAKDNYLTSKSHVTEIFEYDPENSGVTTGVLPLMLTKRTNAVRSRFPINTMVALGPLSNELFLDEFNHPSPLACGIGSSWKKCLDNNALIIGFGTDLTHSLTSIHVAEDSWEDSWPVSGWYHEKKFRIIDGDVSNVISIRERDPRWGALHYAERTLCKDLLNAEILKSRTFNGVEVEVINAKKLNDFLLDMQKKKKGYPYYWV
jgi:aminoglycoside 3-N-acetyltransferase